MGVVIRGQVEDVPGVLVRSWLDRSLLRLNMGEDGRPRYTRWVRSIVLHTTKGIPGGRDQRPQQILPGRGNDAQGDIRVALSWARSSRQAGAHLVVDHDGSAACLADLADEVSYHSGEVNEVSIGIEIYQGSDAELYEGQLESVVALVDYLTRRFHIQRQYQWPYHRRPAARIASGAQDVVGIFGHRDVTTNRGLGDPGDAIFERLASAGYEAVDFATSQDLETWKLRQQELNRDLNAGLRVDGVPGPSTTAAIERSGRGHGLWVSRPGD